MKIKLLLASLIGCFCLIGVAKAEQIPTKIYTIEQFLNTKSYSGGVFSFDEESVLFSCDESGVFNLYSMPVLGGEPTRLTDSASSALFVVSSFPDDGRILFSSDGLGNEIHHIFLREIDGTISDLTPWPGAISHFDGWSKDRKSFFFQSNKRDSRFMDLYEMDIETFESKMLFQNQEGFDIGALSVDKRYLGLTKKRSSNNNELYLYDRSTNSLREIAPHEGDVSFEAVDFSKDSAYLYFLTDEESEFTYLKRFHLETGVFDTVEQHSWDILFCGFSYTQKYRVTGINEDGKTVIHIFDQEMNQAVPLPKLPEGEITSVRISKSEKKMLFYVNGDRSPSDLYSYQFETGAIHKLTCSLCPEIDPNDLVEAEVIRYPSYDGTLIPALYYQPKGVGSKLPALIWVHGGPGGQSRIGYSYLIQYLVNHGYPVLCVNNRGSSGYGKSFFKAADHKHGEADLDDCMSAKQFLIGTGVIDGERIGIIGGSYGGYMTLAALAFRPDEMAVGIDIFGVSNWVRTLRSIPAWWESGRQALYQKIGHPETETAYLESISPLFHAEKIKKPLLVIQGANDPRVLKIESDQIIEAVSKAGVPNHYLIFDDEGHGFVKKENRMKAATTILEFLDQHLHTVH